MLSCTYTLVDIGSSARGIDLIDRRYCSVLHGSSVTNTCGLTFTCSLHASVLLPIAIFHYSFVQQVRFAEDLDISSKDASLLFIYIGICSTISRIVIGQVIDKKWLTALQCVQLCSFTMGVSIVLSSFAKEYSHFVMFAVAFGVTNGGFVTAQSVFLQTILEPDKSAIGLGMGYMVFSVAVCAGPPFAGKI
jgi:predicted MFS family arabinose efflux permease